MPTPDSWRRWDMHNDWCLQQMTCICPAGTLPPELPDPEEDEDGEESPL
jgi:hypothetical protein